MGQPRCGSSQGVDQARHVAMGCGGWVCRADAGGPGSTRVVAGERGDRERVGLSGAWRSGWSRVQVWPVARTRVERDCRRGVRRNGQSRRSGQARKEVARLVAQERMDSSRRVGGGRPGLSRGGRVRGRPGRVCRVDRGVARFVALARRGSERPVAADWKGRTCSAGDDWVGTARRCGVDAERNGSTRPVAAG